MKKFILDHEAIIKKWLENKESITDEMKKYHEKQIGYLQNERICHLIVLVTFALLTLIGVSLLLSYKSIPFALFTLLCLTLLIPYINFYYLLENGIQRWYGFSREMDGFSESNH